MNKLNPDKLNPARLLEAIDKVNPNPAYDRLKKLLLNCQETGMTPDLDWVSFMVGQNILDDWAGTKRKASEDIDLQAGLEHAVGGAVMVALMAEEQFADGLAKNSRWN